MAFLKRANAIVITPHISSGGWSKVRTANVMSGVPTSNLSEQASRILGQSFDPDKHLLTHATIVASVDTVEVPNVKTGMVIEDRKKVNRKYSDYRITAETDKFANNNFDSFARAVLLKSYRTFVGAQNFCYVPGTRIIMGDGSTKPIEDVVVNDLVLTHKGQVRSVVHTFSRSYSGNIVDIFVDRKKSPLSCTPNHPFPVVSRIHCACGCGTRLTKNTSTRKSRIARKFAKGHSKRQAKDLTVAPWRMQAGDLQVGDLLTSPATFQTDNKQSVGYAEARLLGYFMAEGGGFPQNENHIRICLATHETEYIQEVLDCARIIDPECHCSVTPAHTTDAGVVVYLGSRIIYKMMREKIAGNYSHDKILTQVLLSQDEFVSLGFIGAYINGDGDYHKESGRYRITSTSPQLLNQVMLLAGRFSLHCVVCPRNNLGTTGVCQTAQGPVTVTAQHEAFDLIFDQGSTRRLQGYVTGKKGDVVQGERGTNNPLRNSDGFKIHAITEIKYRPYEGLVYNIEVAEDHSYVANGIATFNCEHVQLEELSKGRILDSVIRDVGEALYVDILVATDRKHTELVQSILNHEMSTLSMGATVEETTCTRCGNVAVDETDLCDHIKYQKGSIFHNEMGQKLRTVELCGHPSLDPTGGVRFIEASWVKNPAFTGAVMRNIIDPVTLSQHIKRQAQEILDTPPPQWFDTSIKKVAFDFGDEGGGDEGGESSAPAEPSQPADVLEKIESQVTDLVLDRVVKKINDAQKSKDPPPLSPEQSTAQSNDSIIKEATVKVARAAYAASAKAMVKTAKNEADFMSRIADLDASFGIKADVRLYRTALMHGPISAHKSEREYILKCAKTLRESLDNQEAFTLIRLGRLMEILPKKTPQDA